VIPPTIFHDEFEQRKEKEGEQHISILFEAHPGDLDITVRPLYHSTSHEDIYKSWTSRPQTTCPYQWQHDTPQPGHGARRKSWKYLLATYSYYHLYSHHPSPLSHTHVSEFSDLSWH
jgi:hypothetical protein